MKGDVGSFRASKSRPHAAVPITSRVAWEMSRAMSMGAREVLGSCLGSLEAMREHNSWPLLQKRGVRALMRGAAKAGAILRFSVCGLVSLSGYALIKEEYTYPMWSSISSKQPIPTRPTQQFCQPVRLPILRIVLRCCKLLQSLRIHYEYTLAVCSTGITQ